MASRIPQLRREAALVAVVCAVLQITLSASFLGLVMVSNAFGLEPGKHVSQYGHTAWRLQDGYFSGAPTSITQTRDGFIWIGTRSGLVRFDGAKFVPFTVSEGESLRQPRILSLFGDRDGSLWIGTGADLEHWHDGHLTHFPETRGFVFGFIMQIFRSRDDSIWLARSRVGDKSGPLCRVQGPSLRCFNENDGIEARYLAGAVEDNDGSFWIHDDNSLFHWDPGNRQALPGGVTHLGDVDSLQKITLDGHGTVVLAVAQPGGRVGLATARNGRIEAFNTGTFDGHQLSAQQVFFDSKGALWIGTDSKGIYRVSGTQVDHYATVDGLSNDTINAFFEDREGNIWVATNQGVDRFRDIAVTTYSAREGLSSDTVAAVLAASDGTIWISNFHSLDVLHRDGSVTSFQRGKELPGEVVTSLMEDHNKRIWVGVDGGLQIFDGRGFTVVQRPGGQPVGTIDAMAEDHAGDVWAIRASPGNGSLLHFIHDKFAEEIPFEKLPIAKTIAIAADPDDGVWLPMQNGDVAHWSHGNAEIFALHRAPNTGNVSGLVARPDGSVISSSLLGLTVIRNGQVRRLETEQGLPCARIWTMTSTEQALWLYTECGALELSYIELERWWTDPAAKPKLKILDALDGIQPAASGYFPRSSHSPDGRAWFANSSVLQMVDPRVAWRSVPLLPAHVEQLLADGKTYSTSHRIALPPLTKDVQVDYTSPLFGIPERVHFRYKLDGLDGEWVDAGNRRQAFFNNLSPGVYRFHVSAAAAGSPWGNAEALTTFRILPTFYQTTWFIALCVVCAVLLLFMLIHLRIEALERNLRARLQVRLDERERIARDLHDTLFQNIQGLLLRIDNSTNTLDEAHPTRGQLKEALRLSDQVMAESRERVLELRGESFDQQSIGQALSQVGNDLGKLYATTFRAVELGAAQSLHPLVFEEVFHICREGLFNAFRHARASRVEAEILFAPDTFSIRITDDGIGIDERVLSDGGRPGHFGFKGMMERSKKIGARLTIRSRPGAGTELGLSMSLALACGTLRKGWRWRWLSGFLPNSINRDSPG